MLIFGIILTVIAIFVALVVYGDRVQKREKAAEAAAQSVRLNKDAVAHIMEMARMRAPQVEDAIERKMVAASRMARLDEQGAHPESAPSEPVTQPIPILRADPPAYEPGVLPEVIAALSPPTEGVRFALSPRTVLDFHDTPHWLVAGATGQGKSVLLNTVLVQAVQRSPRDVQLALIDPKRVELAPYGHVPHLWAPIATEIDDAVTLLRDAVEEMEQRYRALKAAGVRNLDGLQRVTGSSPARLLIVVDELGDLMRGKDVEPLLVRLASLGRAAGIHLLLATQRPSADVITGVLKGSLPGRIALRTASGVDSRVILDETGAENLTKTGEFILRSGVLTATDRCTLVTDEDVEHAVWA
jgi:hypothetical protein